MAFGQLTVHATRGPLPWVWLVLGLVIMVLTFYGSSRVFRGRDESDEPRAAWRMSARPRASFWMFLWMAVTPLAIIGDFVPSTLRTDGARSGLGAGGESVVLVLDVIINVWLAVRYFRSWRRLRAMYPASASPSAAPPSAAPAAPDPGVEPPVGS